MPSDGPARYPSCKQPLVRANFCLVMRSPNPCFQNNCMVGLRYDLLYLLHLEINKIAFIGNILRYFTVRIGFFSRSGDNYLCY